MLHGNGMYFYDLGAAGWFGQPSSPNASAALWSGIMSGYKSFFAALNRTGSDETPTMSSRSSDTALYTRESDARLTLNSIESRVGVVSKSDQPASLNAEVAIFVDDTSAATWISVNDGGFINDLMAQPTLSIPSSGAPARMFLVSDLLVEGVDWSPYECPSLFMPALTLQNGGSTTSCK